MHSLPFDAKLPRAVFSLCALIISLALTAPLAQTQSDDCVSATPISGFGVRNFHTHFASSVGGACSMGADVWFVWTAATTEIVTVDTCRSTAFDTVLAVFDGAQCPPNVPLGCNDDTCGLQSEVVFAAVAGQDYLIQIGGFNGARGAGVIEFLAGGMLAGCLNPTSGADLIIGELSDIRRWGAEGSTTGFSLGTTICNVGTTELDWNASSAAHPIIAQNLYRLLNGRFEQLGQSWVAHESAAQQGSLCCDCVPSTVGSFALGIGCSSHTDSQINGSQGSLGPRSEVNPTNGVFAFPHGGQGQTGDRVFKRIQVPTNSIPPASSQGAALFAGAQIVSADDASAGNGANNISWRPLSTSGAPVFPAAEHTRTEEPAVAAWKEADPGVDLRAVDIPGEGRLWVASRGALDLATGLYRYEYCITNINSQRSVGRFSVPIGSGTLILEAGMSFPLSHSGEPYSNDAWSRSIVPGPFGSSLDWATEDMSVNPDANAVRWGTTYSFWFSSPGMPEMKTAQLGLFRPGAQGDPSVAVWGPVSGSGQPFLVDYCAANANSTGAIGQLDIQNVDPLGRTMELAGSNLPPGALALSLVSMTEAFAFVPGSSGTICLGGAIGRALSGAPVLVNMAGQVVESADLDALPQPTGPVMLLPGETWSFQFWHRDTIPSLGLPTSNFTHGVRARFP